MACVWHGQFLQFDKSAFNRLPPGTQDRLQRGGSDVFLNTLAEIALDPKHTGIVFTTFQPLFTELCSRWMSSIDAATAPSIVAALARVLPYAPSHAIFVEEITCRRRMGAFSEITRGDSTSLVSIATDELVDLLVTVLRLVVYDAKAFDCLISLPKMQVLMSRGSTACVKYLAAKLLCLRVGVSEIAFDAIIERTLGSEEPMGMLDGQKINFRFWELWEEERFKALRLSIESSTEKRSIVKTDANPDTVRHLFPEDLLERTPSFAGQLFPRLADSKVPESAIVMTPATVQNVGNVTAALCSDRPVLVTGLEGSGKTAIITDIARRLGMLSNMLTLHLNDQTDAKLLVGMYTSGASPGSFEWKPGVLTTAVLEGRWVFIEDLDRAPPEILGLLVSLLERKELLVPNLGGWITAARSFKLIASIRSSLNSRNEEVGLTERSLGYRHWAQVKLQPYLMHDLREIISTKYSLPRSFEQTILKMYAAVKAHTTNRASNSTTHRPIDIGALLRFCSRICMQLKAFGVKESESYIPDDLYDTVFLDAVDCFAGAYDTISQRDQLARTIARDLQISPERMDFCLSGRLPKRTNSPNIQFGRVKLHARQSKQNIRQTPPAIFADTPQALRQLESLAVTVKMNEPCLLVGETGIGKTAIVQELASTLNAPLTVVNLSQQSEVNDLLGGLKPLSTRALVLPMKESFEDLFDQTFSSIKHPDFVNSLDDAFQKQKWSKILAIFESGLKRAERYFKVQNRQAQKSSKRRKLNLPNRDHLQKSWEDYSARFDILKKHMSANERDVVFSFVEGNLVKAVRSGGWVLLDEINLASPDTLECLADLLSHGPNEAPFLLLSESGNTQKIVAHPDFRLFGAMNPATDIGKKDLPPSIRSRFTELFVHSADTDLASLVQIVSVYLKDSLDKDRSVIERVARLYADIREQETGNQLVDGAGQKPHFTLRTLIRCLAFAREQIPLYGEQRSLIEGFYMCFLTVLNAESKTLVSDLIDKYLLKNLSNRRQVLEQVEKVTDKTNQYVRFKQYWLRRGNIPLSEPESYIITPYVEENLLNLVRATLMRRYPVLLQGPTSSGKTSMIEYLAARCGNKFVRINNHEHTDLQEYLGNYVSTPDAPGGLVYQDGVLVQALRNGHWIVLDELNLAPTDVLEALNRLLDDNRELVIPETQEVIRPHDNFMLFATQNPPGMYGGRKVLSRAFRNRFIELHFDDIPENELETILKERCPQVAPSFCAKIVAVYKKLAILRQSNRLFEQRNSFATLRDLFRWAQRDAADRKQLAIDGFMLLGERVRNEQEREAVKVIIEKELKETIDIDNLYSNPNPDGQYEQNNGTIVWTKAARRLVTLIRSALRHNEPVLLIGDTGCGKTSICQAIANREGIKLNIVNAHQNTETGDLIGSQRPNRNRDTLESQLFVWSDGSLVQSMKLGEYYLLDEISLADDSVLERLNSVLEPSRSILLAEKGSIDSDVSAKDGFQFLATMNPGGDYGKKELSPALRNRFTEIWVAPLSTEDDIVPILEAKLEEPNQHFAKQMVEFGQWFGDVFHRLHSRISIRDMLAWATLINVSKHSDPTFAFVHGAAMVYIDSLGATPSSAPSLLPDSLAQQRNKCVQKLEHIVGIDCKHLYRPSLSVALEDRTFKIGEFSLPRSTDAVLQQPFTFQANTTMSNASRIMRALQLAKPILLEGSPGVGKTTLIVALSEAVGAHLTRINLSDQTDLMDLFGGDVPLEDGQPGQFGWRDAPFLKAMQEGGWVLLDEMNLASQSVLEGLNACLDHRGEVFVPELGRTFTKHEDFKLFAAQNPHVQGGGRKGLPASFVNRFTVVFADTLVTDDLVMICSSLYPDFDLQPVRQAVHYVTQLQQLATAPHSAFEGGSWEFNLRDILRWLWLGTHQKRLAANANLTDYAHVLFEDRLRNAHDVSKLKALSSYLAVSASPLHSHYRNVDRVWYQCGFGLLQRSPLRSNCRSNWTPVSGSKIESAMISIEQNWPLLLVGTSGSGKSSLIHHLASWTGAEVVTLPLNADTDAYDLIGGYEQQDTNRKLLSLTLTLERTIKKLFLSTICEDNSSESIRMLLSDLDSIGKGTGMSLSRLGSIIQHLKSAFPDEYFLQHLEDNMELIRENTQDQRARFEWVDGLLVRAVEKGHWLVLDNANLCSSSVLDRLNALLEPNGSLVIHEHRSLDGSSRIIRPHRDFRIFLTMDPRYGELSRAMRNRCVELYIDAFDGHNAPPMIADLSDSTLFRLRSLHCLDWTKIDEAHLFELLRVCMDHLSINDLSQVVSWSTEVDKGLLLLPRKSKDTLRSLLEALRFVFQIGPQAYELMSPGSRIDVNKLDLGSRGPSEFIRGQPVQPLVNSMLLINPTTETQRRYYRWLSTALDIAIDQFSLSYRLKSLREDALHSARPKNQKSSVLQRSLFSKVDPQLARDPAAPIAGFLIKMGEELSTWVKASSNAALASPQGSIVDNVSNTIHDLFDQSNESDLDSALYQSYLIRARNLAEQAQGFPETFSIGEKLLKALQAFDSGWRLSSGGSVDLLWPRLRPEVASNMAQFRLMEECLRLADEFDDVAWVSNVSLNRLSKVRSSFYAAFQGIKNAQADNRIKEIRQSLSEDEQAVSPAFEQPRYPHFCLVFEGLRQSIHMNDPQMLTRNQFLDVGAARNVRNLLQLQSSSLASRILQGLTSITGIDKDEGKLLAVQGNLPSHILYGLHKVPQVSSGSFRSLCDELDFLGSHAAKMTTTIDGPRLGALNLSLALLHKEVYVAHNDGVQGRQPEKYRFAVQKLHTFLGKVGYESPPIVGSPVPFDRVLFVRVAELFFAPSIENLLDTTTNHEDAAMLSSRAWILFFKGLILLFMPDKPYDPWLAISTERRQWSQRRSRLIAKTDALRWYQQRLSGETKSLRLKFAEDKLQEMGDQPSLPSIVRPQQTRLHLLQAEFSNILRSIVRQIPEHKCSLQERNALKQSLKSSIDRLDGHFAEYSDIVVPVLNMLRGLNIGLELASIAETRSQLRSQSLGDELAVSFSVLGFSFEASHSNSDLPPEPSFQSHSKILKLLRLQRIAGGMLNRAQILWMHRAFDSLYKLWQQNLKVAQKDYAMKTSLYRYAGSKEDNMEEEEEELRELFPNFVIDDDITLENGHEVSIDPRQWAIEASETQENLFLPSQAMTGPTIELYQELATNTVLGINSTGNRGFQQQDGLMPAVLFGIAEQQRNLNAKEPGRASFNFYKDPNVAEIGKLCDLLWKFQTKFTSLQAAWPEHATLGDVLEVVKEILNIQHSEPMASFLPKLEKLHRYIDAWQEVASREYSAASLYTELTALIIAWRRLELSTWARLLDFEDQRCVEDARSWWFIAYQLIIQSSTNLSDVSFLRPHIHGMVSELQSFLSTTSYGLFSHRLDLLHNFVQHASELTKVYPHMTMVAEATSNTFNYFARFRAVVKDRIGLGRQTLEKDMKDTLLLASWKDTNIHALRESARKSHYKLLKVVRKYRSLLGQTVESIVQDVAPLTIVPHGTYLRVIDKASLQPSAMYICKSALHTWENIHHRFKEPEKTASRLKYLAQQPSSAVDTIAFFSEFIQNVVDSATSLQKETPMTLQEDNKELVKHLKSRKRRAFADVLKELKHLGFQSNPDTETLKAQGDVSTILAECQTHCMLNVSDPYFFGLIENMITIRQSARDHSEDLSAAETSRSVGFLEGILAHILSQRKSVVNLLTSLDGLDETLNILGSLQTIEDTKELKLVSKTSRSLHLWYSKLAWVETLSDATSLTLEKHEALGGTESAAVRAELASLKQGATNFKELIRSLPSLPDGISSDLHNKACEDVTQYFAQYEVTVLSWIERLPEVTFVISGLLPWLTSDSECYGYYLNESEQLTKMGTSTVIEEQDFIVDLMGILNSTLSKTQKLHNSQARLKGLTAEPSWYTRNESINASNRHIMNAQNISRNLAKLLKRLQMVQVSQISAVGAFCSIQQPIFVEYARAARALASASIEQHLSLCKVAHTLSALFKTLVTRGFCTPQEQSEDTSKSGKVEEGTGLGEGEGAEDISKDIEDNEDLSELARNEDKEKDNDKEDLTAEKDAVDMADEELEADTGDAEQGSGDEEEKSNEDGENDEIDDEVGSVDAERDDAIDEKLWDGKEEEQDSKKTEDTKGQKTEESKAQEREIKDESTIAEEDLESVEENETTAPEPQGELDDHTKEEDNLELPDDMDLDKEVRETAESDIEDAGDGQSDDDFGSDVEPEADETGETSEEEAEGAPKSLSDPEDAAPLGVEDAAESTMDTEPEDDEKEDRPFVPQDRDNTVGQPEQGDFEEAANEGMGPDPKTNEQDNKASGSRGEQGAEPGTEAEVNDGAPEADGQSQRQNNTDERTEAKNHDQPDTSQEQPFQKLGDALEKWHRWNEEIKRAEDESAEQQTTQDDFDIQKQELEHVPDDTAMADTQALAPALDEQTHALDQNALDAEEKRAQTPPVPDVEEQAPEDQEMEDALESQVEEKGFDSLDPIIPSAKDIAEGRRQPNGDEEQLADTDMEDIDTELSVVQLDADDDGLVRSLEDARREWTRCENDTRDLALILTEQLRLILAPTKAAKMRGDFRTGKRLNIKRIIPYIASQYKRDKIWMRRTVPSKRTYQVLLAVDDSKSMSQGGAGRLALESLALLSRSLSLLEVGQLCVVSFGRDVRVAHPFEKPFAAADAGPLAFQHFGFSQGQTDVRRLVARSLELFRNARAMAPAGPQAGQLWQLQLIISDGLCNDHEDIRRLVRQAMEEHVMIIFVIVDALRGEKSSIVDMSSASFDNGVLRVTRYLDKFPFGYYLIVGDVKDLPNVLAIALRQWFAEVAGSG